MNSMLEILKGIAPIAPLGTFLISAFTLILGICGFYIAKKNLKLSSCKNEFDIFMKLDEKYTNLFKSMTYFNSAPENEKKDAESEVNQAMDRYFNTLDTICLYVLKGSINSQIFYRQYGEIILQLSDQEIFKRYFAKGKRGYYESIHKVVNKLNRRKLY